MDIQKLVDKFKHPTLCLANYQSICKLYW